jgi:thiamine pyrophosphate-dependent acetolactate synthase large subunit-like protein
VKMSVGDFLLKRLAELGARYLFGVPGDSSGCESSAQDRKGPRYSGCLLRRRP